MEIVTGATGAVHVTPIDDAVRNSNAGYSNDKVVFTYYRNLEAADITANEVRVYAGYGMNQGRLFKIPRGTYDSVTIENGSQGYKRADLIVARYTMDPQTGFEDISLVVIRGQSGDRYVDPDYVTGNINEGAEMDDFPLYRVKINGLVIDGDPEPLFTLLPDGGRIGLLEGKFNSDLYTNLESEQAGHLDASEEVNLGVKGVLPVSHGGTGKNNLNEVRQSLGLGSDVTKKLQVTDGGTGANSTSQARANLGVPPTNHASSENIYGKGGSTQYGHVKLSDATDSTSGTADGIAATPKAVKDAKDYVLEQMGQAGYGDMMSSVYCGENGAIIQEKGGTGSTDGSINGCKIARVGDNFGYYDKNGTFKSFRQPTGNATSAQVLSGYTFANASSDAVNGGMSNYSGNNRRTVTPAAGRNTQALSIAAGYHDSVNVNTATVYDNAYQKGRNDGVKVIKFELYLNYGGINLFSVDDITTVRQKIYSIKQTHNSGMNNLQFGYWSGFPGSQTWNVVATLANGQEFIIPSSWTEGYLIRQASPEQGTYYNMEIKTQP